MTIVLAARLAGGIPETRSRHEIRERAQSTQVLELFFPDGGPNVYAGELEVRPPRAPTTKAGH